MAIYRWNIRVAWLWKKQATTRQATLLANWWSNNEQTVSVLWVTASNTVIVSPDPSDFSDAVDAWIYCSAQSTNSLTFTCTDAPSNDIVMNVIIFS